MESSKAPQDPLWLQRDDEGGGASIQDDGGDLEKSGSGWNMCNVSSGDKSFSLPASAPPKPNRKPRSVMQFSLPSDSTRWEEKIEREIFCMWLM